MPNQLNEPSAGGVRCVQVEVPVHIDHPRALVEAGQGSAHADRDGVAAPITRSFSVPDRTWDAAAVSSCVDATTSPRFCAYLLVRSGAQSCRVRSPWSFTSHPAAISVSTSPASRRAAGPCSLPTQ